MVVDIIICYGNFPIAFALPDNLEINIELEYACVAQLEEQFTCNE